MRIDFNFRKKKKIIIIGLVNFGWFFNWTLRFLKFNINNSRKKNSEREENVNRKISMVLKNLKK